MSQDASSSASTGSQAPSLLLRVVDRDRQARPTGDEPGPDPIANAMALHEAPRFAVAVNLVVADRMSIELPESFVDAAAIVIRNNQ